MAAAACAAALLVPASAHAQANARRSPPLSFKTDYYGYAASVSPRIGYSDNINLLPEDFEEGQTIATMALAGSAILASRRFTGIVSGSLDVSQFIENGDTFANQSIGGIGTAELVEDLLYFDVGGSTSRQLVGDAARFSFNINAGQNQRVNVHSISASPYLNRQFEDESLVELRYRFTQVFVGQDDNLRAGILNDSQTQEVRALYNTGDKFGRLTVAAVAFGSRTEETGSIFAPEFEVEQGTLMGEFQYELNSRLALTGAVGLDELRSDAPPGVVPADELSGVFWRAGFRAQPGRRTDVRLEYSRRYDDDFVEADVNYRISRRLAFNARASRVFLTRAQALNSQINVQQRNALEFAEALRDGAALSPEGVVNTAAGLNNLFFAAQTVGIGASNRASAGLTALYDRTQFTANVSYFDEDFGFRRTEGVNFSVGGQRQVSRLLSIYGNVFYQTFDGSVDPTTCIANPEFFGFDATVPGFDAAAACSRIAAGGGGLETIGGRVGGSYRFYRNLSVFAEYAHTRRPEDEFGLGFTENFAQAGVTLAF